MIASKTVGHCSIANSARPCGWLQCWPSNWAVPLQPVNHNSVSKAVTRPTWASKPISPQRAVCDSSRLIPSKRWIHSSSIASRNSSTSHSQTVFFALRSLSSNWRVDSCSWPATASARALSSCKPSMMCVSCAYQSARGQTAVQFGDSGL